MVVIKFFLVVVALKILTNVFRLIATKYYFCKFEVFHKYKNNTIKINRCSDSVSRLFSIAGTQQYVFVQKPFSSFMYRDYISNQLDDKSCYEDLYIQFERTIGVYTHRILETFYPNYWLFLPVKLMEKSHVNLPNLFKVLINLIYWVVTIAAGYFLERFLDSNILQNAFQEFFHNLK